MAGLFSRLKIWATGETVTSSDLNAEFNNVLANIDAQHSEGASINLSEMQSTEDPGNIGTEDLAQPISNKQEIQRLRYVIDRLIGGTQWYSTPDISVNALNTIVNESLFLPRNRILSGRVSAYGQPDFIRANGTDVKLLATATPFVCVIDGQEYTFDSDITLSGLSAGFSAAHTATNSDVFSGGIDSKTAGETVSTYFYDYDRSYINIAGAGAEITGRVGKVAAMKVVNGGAVTDYFLCRILSSTRIESLFRGFFRDVSGSPTNIASLVTGETITILRLTYLFLNTSGTLNAVYNEPFVQADTPASFSNGDFWFDTINETWKTYNGASWIVADSILVGMCVQDSTGCVVSRSSEFFRSFSGVCESDFSPPSSGSVISTKAKGGKICVYGSVFEKINKWSWDLTTDVDVGLTAAAGVWFLYVTNTGDTVLSTVHPNDRFGSMFGFYHPAKPYRCVGYANAASASTWETSETSYASFRESPLDFTSDFSIGLRQLKPRVNAGAYTSTALIGGFARSGAVNVDHTTPQSTTSTSPVDIDNQSVTITTTGKRPVMVGFTSDDSSSGAAVYSGFAIISGLSQTAIAQVNILRGATVMHKAPMTVSIQGGTNETRPLGSVWFIDFPPAGTYTYKAQMFVTTGSTTIYASAENRLFAYEMA